MAKKVAKPAEPAAKTAKSKMTPEEKAAKKKARQEAIKNRPEGQRANSKTIDVFEGANGTKVVNYGYAIRKVGTLVTSVVYTADGEPLATSITLIPGTKVKAKKGHGTIVQGMAGVGKDKHQEEDFEDEDDTADDED